MARFGLSVTECAEILQTWRASSFAVDDQLLVRLANDFGLEAPIDVDPNDIAHILGMPGKKFVGSRSFSARHSLTEALLELLSQIKAQGVSPTSIAGALLIVKINRAMLGKHWGRPIADLIDQLIVQIAPGATQSLGIYVDESCDTSPALILVISGSNGSCREAKQGVPHTRPSEIVLKSEIPEFLRRVTAQ